MAIGRATQVHYNKVLSNIAVEFSPLDLVGTQAAPIFPVMERSDVFPVFDKSMFDLADDTRADGTAANEVSRGWSYTQYLCERHSLKEAITEEMRKNWDSQVDLESTTTEFLKQLVWNNYEYRLFGPTGLFRTTANNIYSQNLNWTNLATADPRGDIENAIEAVEVASGKIPNTIIMTPATARGIMRTAEYQNERHFTVDMQTLGGIKLPTSFYGMQTLYVQALINTTRKGQAPSLTRIMADDVWLGYINPSMGYKQLTYALTLKESEAMKNWYDNEVDADKYEYDTYYCPKLIAKECGALLQSVFTA